LAFSSISLLLLKPSISIQNDEVNAVILGHGFAAQMEAMFTDDLTESDAIALDQWEHRSMMQRMKERMARIGAHAL